MVTLLFLVATLEATTMKMTTPVAKKEGAMAINAARSRAAIVRHDWQSEE